MVEKALPKWQVSWNHTKVSGKSIPGREQQVGDSGVESHLASGDKYNKQGTVGGRDSRARQETAHAGLQATARDF